MFTRIITTIALALTVAGCAVGNKYDLSQGTAPVSEANRSVAVAVTDTRPYVTGGSKPPTFVGLQRAGFGNPWDVNTRSGRSLADDVTTMLVNSYKSKGVEATALSTTPGQATAEIVTQSASTGAERLLVVEMQEWKTDIYAQVTVSWNLTAKVFDASGQELASEQSNGQQGTGSAGIGEDANGQIADTALKQRFGDLLARPSIAAALN